MASKNTIDKVETFLLTLPSEQSKPNIEALNYIRNTAAQMKVDISKWDVIKTFGTNDNNLILDKKTINKIMFEKSQELAKNKEKKAEQPEQNSDFMEQLNKATELLGKAMKLKLQQKIADQTYNVKQYKSELERSMERQTIAQNNFVSAKKELEILEKHNPEVNIKPIEELKKVLAEGVWTNLVVENDYAYLNTVNDVVISFSNKLAGVDVSVNLGQLAVKMSLHNFTLCVIPYKNNISYDGFYHPHVSSGGGICWGNAKESYLKWIETGELANVFRILHSLLCNYNDVNPYININYLKEAGKMSRVREELKHPDKRRKKKEDQEVMDVSSHTTPMTITVSDTGYTSAIVDNVVVERAEGFMGYRPPSDDVPF